MSFLHASLEFFRATNEQLSGWQKLHLLNTALAFPFFAALRLFKPMRTAMHQSASMTAQNAPPEQARIAKAFVGLFA